MRLKNWPIYAIILLAFALRVDRLADQSLWFDETLSWWVATTDIPGFLLPYGAYTPLYYLLVGAISFLGKNVFLLRYASVFFGVLSIVMIYRVGRRVGGERVGLVAALLLAVNPFAIWFAQDARMYAMVPFFVLVAMDGFMRATEGRGWRRMIIGAAGAYFTHTISLFIVYVQLLWLLSRFKQRAKLFRHWAVAQLIAAVPLILWEIWHFMQPVQGVAAVTWIPSPSPLAPALTLWNFVSGDTDTWTPLVLVMAVIVGAVAIYGAWRTPHVARLSAPLVVVAAGDGVGPIAADSDLRGSLLCLLPISFADLSGGWDHVDQARAAARAGWCCHHRVDGGECPAVAHRSVVC